MCIEDDKDYYRLTDSENGEKFPLKWMAVESLMQYKFSEASDVVCFNIKVSSIIVATSNDNNTIIGQILLDNEGSI